MEASSKKQSHDEKDQKELFHVIHKVPSGDGPYVRAKHAQVGKDYDYRLPSQMIETLDKWDWKPFSRYNLKFFELVQKDPEASIVWFWKAINAGDRVDSALKDMAVVMKQLDRTEEAIEAIKSFRSLCSKQAQESLDNVLIDLYKKCGKIDEQILLLKQKLRMIYHGEAFNGKPTKTARSHGKKFQVSIKQETSRILGNLAWAYMQKSNFIAAEVIYRKAQMIEPDANKASNLCLSLIKQARYDEARSVLEDVLKGKLPGSDDSRTRTRANELLRELESRQPPPIAGSNDDDFLEELDHLLNVWAPPRSRRLPIFEEISAYRDQIAC